MKTGILAVLMMGLWFMFAAPSAWSDDLNPATVPGLATAPAPEVPVPAEAAATPVEIKDAVVCQDVVGRAPQGKAEVFSKELSKVYCFCRVVGMQGEGAIVHNWYYQGALKSSTKLPVRAANWRTWSHKNISPEHAGEWMVEIINESGMPLESVVFVVQ